MMLPNLRSAISRVNRSAISIGSRRSYSTANKNVSNEAESKLANRNEVVESPGMGREILRWILPRFLFGSVGYFSGYCLYGDVPPQYKQKELKNCLTATNDIRAAIVKLGLSDPQV